jgi:hypothetical protein
MMIIIKDNNNGNGSKRKLPRARCRITATLASQTLLIPLIPMMMIIIIQKFPWSPLTFPKATQGLLREK